MIDKLILIILLVCWLPVRAADTYAAESGVLSIPLVNVNETYYANVKISIGKILSIGTKKGSSLAYDTYDSATNQLYIPIVHVGNTTYYFVTITVGAVLGLEGSFFPVVKSQDPIAYRKTVTPNPLLQDPLISVSLPSNLAPVPSGTNLKVWISDPYNPSAGLMKTGLFISPASVSNWKYYGQSTDGSMYLTLADGSYLLDTVEPSGQGNGTTPYARKRYTIVVAGGIVNIPEAVKDPTGYFLLTLTKVNQANIDFLKILNQTVSVPVSSYPDSSPCKLKDQATSIRSVGSLSAGFPKVPVRLSSYGRIKALVVPLDFPDLPGVDNTVTFFSPIVKTVSDFYVAQSFGKVAMDFDIVPNWVRMPFLSGAYTMTWASAGKTSGDFTGYLNAVLDATDGPIDFSQYEAVYFLVPKEMPFTTMSYGPAFTGVATPNSIIVNGASGGADMYHNLNNGINGATWKWMVHETGHLFGLFDEDLEHKSQSLGSYSVMANSWSKGSIELVAWDRYIQGWLSNSQVSCITPTSLLANSQSFELTPIERQTNELKAIMIPLNSSKILVIESRKNEGFDVISSSDEGVLVYTVDMTLGSLKGGYVIQPRVGAKDTNYYQDALLKAGDSISVGNIKISVNKLSKTVDTVQVSVQ